MSTLVSHRVAPGRGYVVDAIGRSRGRVGVTPDPMARPRVRDREPFNSPRQVAPLRPVWVLMLLIVARVGLALLITAGFAIALGVYAGLPALGPNMIRACEGIFLWTLILVSSGSCE